MLSNISDYVHIQTRNKNASNKRLNDPITIIFRLFFRTCKSKNDSIANLNGGYSSEIYKFTFENRVFEPKEILVWELFDLSDLTFTFKLDFRSETYLRSLLGALRADESSSLTERNILERLSEIHAFSLTSANPCFVRVRKGA